MGLKSSAHPKSKQPCYLNSNFKNKLHIKHAVSGVKEIQKQSEFWKNWAIGENAYNFLYYNLYNKI